MRENTEEMKKYAYSEDHSWLAYLSGRVATPLEPNHAPATTIPLMNNEDTNMPVIIFFSMDYACW